MHKITIEDPPWDQTGQNDEHYLGTSDGNACVASSQFCSIISSVQAIERELERISAPLQLRKSVGHLRTLLEKCRWRATVAHTREVLETICRDLLCHQPDARRGGSLVLLIHELADQRLVPEHVLVFLQFVRRAANVRHHSGTECDTELDEVAAVVFALARVLRWYVESSSHAAAEMVPAA